MGGVKLTLDLAIGETSAIESTDKGKIQDIVQKVKDLNGRLQDIRREQVFQRVSGFISYLCLGAGIFVDWETAKWKHDGSLEQELVKSFEKHTDTFDVGT